MKRRYIKWDQELASTKISVADMERIRNSVTVFVKTSKGWNSIAVCYTKKDAQEWIDRILTDKIKLKYEHKNEFKIV
jgi:hypothetical protein